MKAPDFAYIRPASLDAALTILHEAQDRAVPLAGGQSLLAGLNMRLSTPEILVDIGELRELKGLALEGETVRIGALVRHREVLESELVRRHLPILAEAVSHVGHVAIRNRGTFGGSVAYADPAAELPACVVALGGTIVVGSVAGCREIHADEFFTGLLETALRPGELIVEIRLPVQRPTQSWGFAELSRRHGDFALAGLAALVTVVSGAIGEATLVYMGCTDRAKRATAVEACVRGCPLPLGERDGLAAALSADLDPVNSPGCSAVTKLHLAKELTTRVINALKSGLEA